MGIFLFFFGGGGGGEGLLSNTLPIKIILSLPFKPIRRMDDLDTKTFLLQRESQRLTIASDQLRSGRISGVFKVLIQFGNIILNSLLNKDLMFSVCFVCLLLKDYLCLKQ